MAQATYMICDHCGAKAIASGVGDGNVSSVQIDLDIPLASKSKEHLGADLCIDCQGQILQFMKGFGLVR